MRSCWDGFYSKGRVGGRTLFQARRRGYFNTAKRGCLPLPHWWKISLSGRNRLLAQTHQSTEQFTRHTGRAHRMVWTGRNLRDRLVPTPAMSREPSSMRAPSPVLLSYPLCQPHELFLLLCNISLSFPASNQCLFYIRIQNASLF